MFEMKNSLDNLKSRLGFEEGKIRELETNHVETTVILVTPVILSSIRITFQLLQMS